MATCFLGVDIGGTYIKTAMVSEDGKVLKSFSFPTPVDLSGDDF